MTLMKKINEDGVEIVKEVEDALYTQYITLGWTEVKKEKKVVKPVTLSKTKEEPKEEE